MNGSDAYSATEAQYVRRHHKHEPRENQCTSALVKHIKAPAHLVWSLVRRFDQPQRYKPFVSSTERLELLDDEEHILGVQIVGGDHRLKNYSSIMTVHPEFIDGRPGTLVIESFVVDVPDGNTKDETCYFVKALIRCNLKSLADVSERMAVQDRVEPVNQF
ncbi:abscisic acid receptor PYL3-like [Populus alba x Populus x berolinensis]|uniref:Abscisic acid receptor PYL3-like n=1 Tax=Populus alba x Populus x berolinensis TaxID=444605 RepID=A0AAD6PYL1_9ROSI|nr:abscisic acid receptor PYL3-like [Populus alba x Populus x berolinensis]